MQGVRWQLCTHAAFLAWILLHFTRRPASRNTQAQPTTHLRQLQPLVHQGAEAFRRDAALGWVHHHEGAALPIRAEGGGRILGRQHREALGIDIPHACSRGARHLAG